jgi:hypothetical protein
MASEELDFDSVKEDRGWYFVEYQPPQGTDWFATLQVVVTQPASDHRVAAAMELEGKAWLKRYSVPLMVSAFDDVGELRDLGDTRPCAYVMAYCDVNTGKPRLCWRELREDEIIDNDFDDETLLRVYAGIPFTRTTPADRDEEFRASARSVRTGRRVVVTGLLVWLAAIPVAWAILQWAGPRWLGVLVLVYCTLKALIQALKLLGVLKPLRREQETQERNSRMEHYFYHCEQNPEGFERLKIENFERDAREEILNEAQVLREEPDSVRDHDEPWAEQENE